MEDAAATMTVELLFHGVQNAAPVREQMGTGGFPCRGSGCGQQRGRPGRVGLDAALLVSAGNVSLEVMFMLEKGTLPARRSDQSARAHSVHVLRDRPTVVKIFTRSCLLLYHSDCFSADASRVLVSEWLLSADTTVLHFVLSLGMLVCLPRKTFSNT